MKTLPNVDTQWEPSIKRCDKLAAHSHQLQQAAYSNDYDAVSRFITEIRRDLRHLEYHQGYMSGFYAACEQREQEDAEGVLDP